MAFVEVPNTAEVDINGTFQSQEVQNTLYFEQASPWIEATLEVLAAEVADWVVADLLPLFSTGYSLRNVTVTDLSASDGLSVIDTSQTGEAGEVTGDTLPNNCSIAIQFLTGLQGRSFRGRNFIPSLSESQVDNNVVKTEHCAALIVAYADIDLVVIPGTGISGLNWVVVSRFSNGAERATGVTTPIQSIGFFDQIIDSQRRRLPGRGV